MQDVTQLAKLGADLRDARRRRRISTALMAQRAGVGRATLYKIERGDPNTSLGNYASVLFVLGLADRLADLADVRHDPLGRMLADEELPQRIRPRRRKEPKHGT